MYFGSSEHKQREERKKKKLRVLRYFEIGCDDDYDDDGKRPLSVQFTKRRQIAS